MRNKLYRMQCIYSEYWECYVPKKRGAGTYYLRGTNNRFRKSLKKADTPF